MGLDRRDIMPNKRIHTHGKETKMHSSFNPLSMNGRIACGRFPFLPVLVLFLFSVVVAVSSHFAGSTLRNPRSRPFTVSLGPPGSDLRSKENVLGGRIEYSMLS